MKGPIWYGRTLKELSLEELRDLDKQLQAWKEQQRKSDNRWALFTIAFMAACYLLLYISSE